MIIRKVTITKPNTKTDFPSDAKSLKNAKKQYDELLEKAEGFKSVEVNLVDELTQERIEKWESAKHLSDFKFEVSKLTDMPQRKVFVSKNKIEVTESIEIE